MFQGAAEGLLMRFTSPVTSLAVTRNHTHLAAGSSEFTIKVVELNNMPSCFSLVDHDAPVLCVTFDPPGKYLVSWENIPNFWSFEGVVTSHDMPAGVQLL